MRILNSQIHQYFWVREINIVNEVMTSTTCQTMKGNHQLMRCQWIITFDDEDEWLWNGECEEPVNKIDILFIPYSIILYITFFKNFWGRKAPGFLNCYILHNITFLFPKKCYSSVERIFCLPIIPYSIILYITFFKNFWGRKAPGFLNMLYITQRFLPFS